MGGGSEKARKRDMESEQNTEITGGGGGGGEKIHSFIHSSSSAPAFATLFSLSSSFFPVFQDSLLLCNSFSSASLDYFPPPPPTHNFRLFLLLSPSFRFLLLRLSTPPTPIDGQVDPDACQSPVSAASPAAL